VLAASIRRLAVPALVRATLQRRFTTILVYHDPSPETFAAHVDFLREHYSLISLRQFLDARRMRTALPPRPLVLTLDDGYRGNYDLLPVFETLPAPPTIFLCAGIVGTSKQFWFQHIDDPMSLRLLPDRERVERLRAAGFDEDAPSDKREALSRDEVEAMRYAVDFQAHAMLHPSLPRCDDESARAEIGGAKRHLEESFGLDVYAYAYPFGDQSPRDQKLVSELGYACALKSAGGFNSRDVDAFNLRRICIGDDDSIDRVAVKTIAIWDVARSVQSAIPSRPHSLERPGTR
jgi:peptidoglycan/xylan/chitin deacetylase (PgdA/CDA1 family)